MLRYGYAVQDDIGNDFNKQETSDGGVVTGQYSVLLPDGRIQTVTYSVAPNTGFVVSLAIILALGRFDSNSKGSRGFTL